VIWRVSSDDLLVGDDGKITNTIKPVSFENKVAAEAAKKEAN